MTTPSAGSSLPRALAPRYSPPPDLRFVLALLGAGLLHLLLILAVSFEAPAPRPRATSDEALEVLILWDQGLATDTPAPDSALSQRSRYGESNQGDAAITVIEGHEAPSEEPPEPLAPAPMLAIEEGPGRPDQGGPPQEEPVAEPEEVPELNSPTAPEGEAIPQPPPQAETLTAEDLPAEPPQAPPVPAVSAAQILGSRNQEIARLEASLEARTAAYASRQRRKSVSASTREFRYASYLGAWARKVERIGNLNYPQAAKEQQLYGSLILHVALRRDGSVEAIRVVRSSGQGLLDQAAVNIVNLAAPYAPFPPEIAAETDVLDIVRTWQFQRGGTLGWEQ